MRTGRRWEGSGGNPSNAADQGVLLGGCSLWHIHFPAVGGSLHTFSVGNVSFSPGPAQTPGPFLFLVQLGLIGAGFPPDVERWLAGKNLGMHVAVLCVT